MFSWLFSAPHASRPLDNKITILTVVLDFDHYEEVELFLYTGTENSMSESWRYTMASLVI